MESPLELWSWEKGAPRPPTLEHLPIHWLYRRVHSIPFGKARHRSSRHGGYTDPKESNRLAALQECLRTTDIPRFENRALIISWTALFPRPQSLAKYNAKTRTYPAGPERIPHGKKPDRDNIDKAVLDSLKQLGRLDDDCRVYAGVIQKLYVGLNTDPANPNVWEDPGFELWIGDCGLLP